MKQQELERMLEAARDYNEPPEPPREEMWAAIRAGLDERAARPADDLEARRRRNVSRAWLRRSGPWALGLAAAAALVVAFGLGRLTGGAPASDPATAGTVASDETSLPARLAAADHLGEAEAMLTLYRSSDRAEDRAATARWARELLSTTRLLIDSRVGGDPELATLLGDLELVLVQIASESAVSGDEQEMIEEGIERRQLLTKLRTAAEGPVEHAM
jgi:hypothetical protein